jgi:ABC-type sugar transport system substrate-binding protein
VIAALAVAACGSSNNSSSSSTPASSSPASTTTTAGGAASGTKFGLAVPQVSAADLQATIQKAFGLSVPASQLPDVAVDAFKFASEPVTPAQSALVKQCLKASSCDTGVSGGITIADLEANGAVNPFRQVLRAIVDLQAIRTGKVSKIVYSDARGDVKAFLTNYRNLITQKVNVITGTFDFGPSMLPLTRVASKAGILVVPVSTTIPNVTGKGDVAFDVKTDLCQYGTDLGTKAALGNTSGTVALFTGTPGNNFGAEWEPCAEKVLKAAGLTVTKGNTNWSPQGETQAAASLASVGQNVKAVVYDYLPNSFFTKYLALGKTPPTQVGGNAAFGTVPLWKKIRAKAPNYQFYVAPSQLAYSYVSVVGALEKIGGRTDIPLHVTLPNPLVPLTAYLPQYNPKLPASMEFGSLLPDDIAAVATGGTA